jgi:hypothetical protein
MLKEEGRGKREEGRGKREEEGRGKKKEEGRRRNKSVGRLMPDALFGRCPVWPMPCLAVVFKNADIAKRRSTVL